MKTYYADTPLNSATITPKKDFVILGGGQDAMGVTQTSARQGKFEARFYHKIFEEEIGRVRGHFGPLSTRSPVRRCMNTILIISQTPLQRIQLERVMQVEERMDTFAYTTLTRVITTSTTRSRDRQRRNSKPRHNCRDAAYKIRFHQRGLHGGRSGSGHTVGKTVD